MAGTINCPVCGENISSAHRFCPMCQAPLGDPSSSASTRESSMEPGNVANLPEEDSSKEADTLPWLAGWQPLASQDNDKDKLTEWIRSATDSPPLEISRPASSLGESFLIIKDAPDWLRPIAADTKFIASETETPPATGEDFSAEIPDWLRLAEDTPQTPSSGSVPRISTPSKPPALTSTGELPAWLSWKDPVPEKSIPEPAPTWLKIDAPASMTGELPAWLSGQEHPSVPLSGDEKASSQTPAEQDDLLGDLPSWLKASALTATLFEEEASEPQAAPAENIFKPQVWSFSSSSNPESSSYSTSEKALPFESLTGTSAEQNSISSTDKIFTEMPDWLTSAVESSPQEISKGIHSNAIAPGELPSWVQAMHPAETTDASALPSPISSGTIHESDGALFGIQGVLPALPGFGPTSKPRPYSIRLKSSEEQQGHVEFLEKILTDESTLAPLPLSSSIRATRGLRWFLFLVIFSVVILGLFSRAPIFSLPVEVPREAGRAMDFARSLPSGARVLVIFDFDPARSGEMEAVAAPYFDQMVFYGHPRLTFIASNETGAMLAERFVAGPLAAHYQNGGFSYVNLGYLPGGSMGIRAFSQTPRRTSALDINLQPAWVSVPENFNSLSELFMAMLVVTDNADTARMWIEQSQPARGDLPLVVLSSAQAAPMIQPYFDSNQVNGMVSGLYGGAVLEQHNPGSIHIARRYWDAYSMGMLISMSFLLGGGFWHLILGLMDRSAARKGK